MKYLESLDPKIERQDIGIGEYIWVELTAVGSASIETSAVVGVNLHILASAVEQTPDNGDLVYDMFILREHDVFNNMPYVDKFDSNYANGNSAAYLDLDQVKEILNYCDRIASMKAFM
jgi:hypothetical protein